MSWELRKAVSCRWLKLHVGVRWDWRLIESRGKSEV